MVIYNLLLLGNLLITEIVTQATKPITFDLINSTSSTNTTIIDQGGVYFIFLFNIKNKLVLMGSQHINWSTSINFLGCS